MALIESKDYQTDNERIAGILGFKKFVGHKTNGPEDDLVQWTYPNHLRDFVRGIPCTEIPDFTAILNRYFEDERKYRFGIYERSNP